MNENNMKNPSKTDWSRIDTLTDEAIDTSDIPPLTETFFARAEIRHPRRTVTVTLPVDAEVWEWFKAQGQEYEQCINIALRIYAESQSTQPSRLPPPH